MAKIFARAAGACYDARVTLTLPDAVALVAGIVIPLAALTLAAARFVVSRMDRADRSPAP